MRFSLKHTFEVAHGLLGFIHSHSQLSHCIVKCLIHKFLSIDIADPCNKSRDYYYIYCLFAGTGKTVTGVHMAYWFTKRNLQLLSQEDRSYTDPAPPEAPPQVIYCGPSNKSVDLVARKCKLE